MMKPFALFAVVLAAVVSLAASDAADAKRLGGGANLGAQRQSIAPRSAAPAPTQPGAASNPVMPAQPGAAPSTGGIAMPPPAGGLRPGRPHRARRRDDAPNVRRSRARSRSTRRAR